VHGGFAISAGADHRFDLSSASTPELEADMAGKAKPIPDGYHSVTAYLSIKGASDAIEFYKRAFGAEEKLRLPGPDGSVAHAELQIGDSRIMLAEEMGADMPDRVCVSPTTLRGTTVGLMIYLPDVDAAVSRAAKAGAAIRRPLQDQFYGDRSATLEDPYGHIWTLATNIEEVSPEEMERRMAAYAKG
jgi:PhnB protein